MLRIALKSKLHRVRVTETNLNYEGSITIDEDLINAADIQPNELVRVANLNNGARFETYVMKGEPGSKTVCLNGGAARLAHVGDILIIFTYCLLEIDELKRHKPTIVYVDENNQIIT